jgi:hypothetical protein
MINVPKIQISYADLEEHQMFFLPGENFEEKVSRVDIVAVNA